MLDRGGMSEACVSPSHLLRNAGMADGEALYMSFVDDGVVPRCVRRRFVAPVEGLVDNHGLGCAVRRVLLREAEIGVLVSDLVAEHLGSPVDVSVDRLRIRVEHQLVAIEAMTGRGLVGSVDPKAVALPGTDSRHIAVPHPSSGLL